MSESLRATPQPRFAGRLALSQRELATALGVSERTLRTWMREEGLPFVRVRGVLRFSLAAVEEWLAERELSDDKVSRIVDELVDT